MTDANRRPIQWVLYQAMWLIGFLCLLSVNALAADWPCYKADAARSGVTPEQLSFPPSVKWVYEPSQPPKPAWPEPSWEMHRVDFDYAFQPVVAGSLVYFGSSADDTIRALDMRTGQVKWRFTTGGPVRFAPHIANGKCYAASDDGFAYCLDAATGKLLWKFRAAPEDRQLVGNGRMISRWPCRSGVLVADGVVYVTAGMWPSEGIYVYGLDAETGKQLWCNDTSGSMYIEYPHGSHALGGVAPQGYLLASKDRLIVPTGRSVPAGFERNSGRFLYRAQYHGNGAPGSQYGGCWATVAGNLFFNATHGKGTGCYSEILGVAGPLNGDGLLAYSLSSGRWARFQSGKDYGYNSYRLLNKHRVLISDQMLYALGGGRVEASDYATAGRPRRKWTANHPPRVYCVALAGDALLVGGDGTLTAFHVADGKEIWSGRVDGQVRGLVIASGHIFAATEKGRIHCFARGEGERSAVSGRAAESAQTSGKAVTIGAASDIVNLIRRFNITKGYALVIGKPDARFAETIATQTRLHVVSVLRDEDKVVSERKRLVEKGSVYGSNVVVQHLKGASHLPYASYFANAVVVCGNTAEFSGKEVYRVLRPCGGLMCFVDVNGKDAEKLLKGANAPEEEVSVDGESVVLVKGKLPGAFDWNSKVTTDQRVKWPLELSWFGGPGCARMPHHRQWLPGKPSRSYYCLVAPSPVVANGRYFAVGKNHLIAVDAYNGCELWSRWIGGLVSFAKKTELRAGTIRNKMDVTADEDNAYVSSADFCLQLDAQTGRIRKLFNESGEQPLSPRFSVDEMQAFTSHTGPKHAGTVTIEKMPDGLTLALTAKTPKVTAKDCWELYFDFRSPEERLLPYGPGAFQAVVVPDTMSCRVGPMGWRPHPGLAPAHPQLVMEQKEAPDAVSVVVRITWEDVRRCTGKMPKEFAFAATLNMHAGDQTVVRDHLFADGSASFLGHGWAVFTLDAAAHETSAGDGPIVPCGKWEDLPAQAREPVRMPTRDGNDPYYYSRGRAQNIQRVTPFTGEADGDLSYFRSYGCGGVISSSTMDFFRSSTIGFYDLADDSGMRNFAGVRPGCGISIVPALGLMISSEASASCQCSYNFQTSLALAPAAKRSNEDWSIFNDRLAMDSIEQAALNLGATGDRRDEEDILWFGIPRIKQTMGKFANVPFFRVPVHIDCHDGFGPYRFNADRLTIKGTRRPWIYASGYRGLKSATLDLLYYDPRSTGIRFASRQPPIIEGDLSDPCWDGSGRIQLPDKKASVYLREDADNLYIAYEQRPIMGWTWKAQPLKANTQGEDAPVWEDDSFEVHIQRPKVSENIKGIHLGVSASGARYDGLWALGANKADVEENSQWNGVWTSAAKVDKIRFCVEMAIAWNTLSAAGLNREESLRIRFEPGKLKLSRGGVSRLLEEISRSSYVVGPANSDVKLRPYTVRLHFAEPDDVVPKQRVFDVKLQRKVVFRDMDVVKAAGGTNKALVKEVKGIMADKLITLELVPAATEMTSFSVPIISGIEVIAEDDR